MGYMDLICTEAVSLTPDAKCPPYKSDLLRVGNDFKTYLYYELPPAAFFVHVISAKLILYKIPVGVLESSSTPRHSQYSACPLLEFFSIYGSHYAPPETDGRLCVNYHDQSHLSYTEADITAIVESWVKGAPENKGLLLSGTPHARYLTYASDQFETVGMRPKLRLTYEGFPGPLSAAPCTVRVYYGGSGADEPTPDLSLLNTGDI